MSESLDPGPALSWRALRYKWLAAIATAVLAADQATKAWITGHLALNTFSEGRDAIPVIRGFFYIIHVGNTGAAWSIFAGRSIALAVVSAASLVAIFVWRKALELSDAYAQACFGLICGGITGNLADRIIRGHVVDFLDFHFGSYVYPTFNVADSAITVGIFLYILSIFRKPSRAR